MSDMDYKNCREPANFYFMLDIFYFISYSLIREVPYESLAPTKNKKTSKT